MPLLPLSDAAADRLFGGLGSPDGGPGPWAGLTAALRTARGPATDRELAGQEPVVAACVAEVLSSPTPPHRVSWRKNMISRAMGAKAAAGAVVAVLGLGSAAAAAAATGSLPGQSSHANHHPAHGLPIAAARVASAPSTGSPSRSASPAAPHSSTGPSSPGSIPPTGPANTHAQFGLCNAFLAGPSASASSVSAPQRDSSTAFSALIAQNGGVAATTAYCHKVLSSPDTAKPGNDTSSSGETSDQGRPSDNGHGQPAGAGQSSDVTTPPTPAGPPAMAGSSAGHAPVDTPDRGGTTTAGSASGGADSTGATMAGSASAGASTAGSGHASIHR